MDPNADDLAFLETLRQVDPITFVASRGRSYAVVGSFPSEILEKSKAPELSVNVGEIRLTSVSVGYPGELSSINSLERFVCELNAFC